jgi:hypothetical protein
MQHEQPSDRRSIGARAWDVAVGLFMLTVGIPVQLIVAALVGAGFAAILRAMGIGIGERAAGFLIAGMFVVLNIAAFVDWRYRGVEGKVLSRSDFFYLTPRGLYRIATGRERPQPRDVLHNQPTMNPAWGQG